MQSNLKQLSLGIIRHIDFYNIDNSIDSADAKSAAEHKDNYDSTSLIPVLNNFFNYHPGFKYKYFWAMPL